MVEFFEEAFSSLGRFAAQNGPLVEGGATIHGALVAGGRTAASRGALWAPGAPSNVAIVTTCVALEHPPSLLRSAYWSLRDA